MAHMSQPANDISIGSAVFAGHDRVTNTETNRQTGHATWCKMHLSQYAPSMLCMRRGLK